MHCVVDVQLEQPVGHPGGEHEFKDSMVIESQMGENDFSILIVFQQFFSF